MHRAVHPDLDVEGCFACRISTVMVAPSATPSRRGGADAADNVAREKQWSVDHAAYRRLVKDGLQPKTLDGAAVLEREATCKADVELGLGAGKHFEEVSGDAA